MFHHLIQTPRKQQSPRGFAPRDFIIFSVFGTGDETLALVIDILLRIRTEVRSEVPRRVNGTIEILRTIGKSSLKVTVLSKCCCFLLFHQTYTVTLEHFVNIFPA